MATRRDLMDSYAFGRRRLLAAFLRPGPNRSEESAPRPLRSFTASAVIGVLVLVGLGIYGAFDKGTPHDWAKSLIVDSATGSRFIERDGKLYPVLNLASARLLEDPNGFSVTDVPDSALAGEGRGQPTGILGAPDSLPSPSSVQNSAWQICSVPTSGAAAPQTQVFIGDPMAGTPMGPADGVIVRNQQTGVPYLVQQGVRYALQSGLVADAFYQGIDADIEPVQPSWLNQIPDGGAIWFPVIPGLGTKVSAAVAHPASMTKVGDAGTSQDPDGTVHYYVLLPSGLMQISQFEWALIREDPRNGAHGVVANVQIDANEAQATASAVQQNAMLADPTGGGGNARSWPAQSPNIVNHAGAPDQTLCAVPGGFDQTTKQTAFSLIAAAAPPVTLGPGDGARPALAGPTAADVVHVQQGKGALVQAIGSQGAGAGQVWLITDTGVRYLVVPNDDPSTQSGGQDQDTQALLEDTLARLGYANIPPTPLSFTVVNLVQAGPALSVKAAEQQHSPSQTGVTAPLLPPPSSAAA